MWDGLPMLLLLCIVMGTASFLAGSLPLALSLSSRQLRLITALGTGVLVGTSLIVIIPEGVETLYSAAGSGHGHGERALSQYARRGGPLRTFNGDMPLGVWRRGADAVAMEIGVPADTHAGFVTGPDDGFKAAQEGADDTSEEAGPGGDENEAPQSEEPENHSEEGTHHEPHAWVGVSLITGFILMYLIDTIPQHATASSKPQRFAVNLNNFSINRSNSIPPETPIQDTPHAHGSRPSSTTVGLVIHAAADGIALGASSTTTSRLTFIIFIALMIHKAPAAFGLTSVLLKQGLSKRMARAHLIIFSLAAPIGALLAWGGAHILGYSSTMVGNSGSTEFATGVLLLFSAGTFLYVAMHTMQEAGSHAEAHGEVNGNGYAGAPLHDEMMYDQMAGIAKVGGGGPGLVDTLVTVGGMLLPLLTQFGHAH